jgi:hypothetical protein
MSTKNVLQGSGLKKIIEDPINIDPDLQEVIKSKLKNYIKMRAMGASCRGEKARK